MKLKLISLVYNSMLLRRPRCRSCLKNKFTKINKIEYTQCKIVGMDPPKVHAFNGTILLGLRHICGIIVLLINIILTITGVHLIGISARRIRVTTFPQNFYRYYSGVNFKINPN